MAEQLSIVIDAVDRASATLRTVQGSVGSLSQTVQRATGLLTALGVGVGAVGLGAALRGATLAAAEDEDAMIRLRSAVERTGQAWGAVRPEIEATLSTIQKTTRFTDDEAATALQRVIGLTGGYANSTRLLKVAMDVAEGTGRGLEGTVMLIARAASTGGAGLSRMGIAVQGLATGKLDAAQKAANLQKVLTTLEARFGGMTTKLSDTTTFLNRAKNEFGEFMESVGRFVIHVGPALIASLAAVVPILVALYTLHLVRSVQGFAWLVAALLNVRNAAAATTLSLGALAAALTLGVAVAAFAAFQHLQELKDEIAAAAAPTTRLTAALQKSVEMFHRLKDTIAATGKAPADAIARMVELRKNIADTEQSIVKFEEASGLSNVEARAAVAKMRDELSKLESAQRSGAEAWSKVKQEQVKVAETTRAMVAPVSVLATVMDRLRGAGGELRNVFVALSQYRAQLKAIADAAREMGASQASVDLAVRNLRASLVANGDIIDRTVVGLRGMALGAREVAAELAVVNARHEADIARWDAVDARVRSVTNGLYGVGGALNTAAFQFEEFAARADALLRDVMLRGFAELFEFMTAGSAFTARQFAANMIRAIGQVAVQLGTMLVLAGSGLALIPGMQVSAGAVPFGLALIALGGATAGLASRLSAQGGTAPTTAGGSAFERTAAATDRVNGEARGGRTVVINVSFDGTTLNTKDDVARMVRDAFYHAEGMQPA